MIDHVSIAVRDLDAAARFYEAVLARIGYAKLDVRPGTVAFGKRHGELWLNHRPEMFAISEGDGAHVCLRARRRPRSTRSMRRRWRRAGRPTARPACGRIMGRAITPPSSAIPTATGSRP
jgi:catechol 2,3-dioxygenase-like lactoylglutathione lyase family enzyme